MKYAVIKTGGKQYKVKEGEEIVVDKIESEKGKKINFNEILLMVEGRKVKIGTPYVSGAKVIGEIVAQEKGEKVRVAKFRAKSRYRKVIGFRPLLTKVKIEKIKTG